MKLFIITIFLMLAGTVFAQYTLEAVVLDGLTRQPVVNTNVAEVMMQNEVRKEI